MHGRCIIHSDVKTDNIMIRVLPRTSAERAVEPDAAERAAGDASDDFEVRLADFSRARSAGTKARGRPSANAPPRETRNPAWSGERPGTRHIK